MSKPLAALCLAAALLAAAPSVDAQTSRGGSGTYATNAAGDILLNGSTEPFAKVDIPSAIRGILAEVNVREGQIVKKGDSLAKLDDAQQAQQVVIARLQAEQMAEIKNAENTIAFKQAEYEKSRKVLGEKTSEVLQKELDVKSAELALAVHKDKQKQDQAKLRQEEITLEKMVLRSPIDGAVLRVNKQAGEQTDETPVLTVVQTSRLSAVFYLPKLLFGKVNVGDKVPLTFETGAAGPKEGVVVAVDPAVEAGIFRVKLEVDNADRKIPAGIGVTWTWKK